MSRLAKLLIGVAAALLAGWIAHEPLGQGDAFIASVEAKAKSAIREAGVPGIEVSFTRETLRRDALLSGPANDFQREGQGQFPGINDRILAVPGVSGVAWTDSGPVGGGGLKLPLLVETELLVLGFFALGILLGRLVFRPKREHFL
jgi:hypothetical protein